MKNRNISILMLVTTLTDSENGNYTEDGITNLVTILNQIMTRGFYRTEKNVTIGATGIEPYFKLNEKSVRIFLKTSDVRDTLVLNTIDNKYAEKDGADTVHIGPLKYFKASHAQICADKNIQKLEKYMTTTNPMNC